MEDYTKTPSHKLNHQQLLELRGVTEEQMTTLMEMYGSCIYEVLFRVDLLEFEFNDDYDLFLTHTKELFNDDEFDILIDSFESTSETDDEGLTYETQVLNECK